MSGSGREGEGDQRGRRVLPCCFASVCAVVCLLAAWYKRQFVVAVARGVPSRPEAEIGFTKFMPLLSTKKFCGPLFHADKEMVCGHARIAVRKYALLRSDVGGQ